MTGYLAGWKQIAQFMRVGIRTAQRLGPRDLMDVMGWRTVEMAMRYVHGNDEAKTKALEMLGTAPQQGKILPFNHAKAN